MPQGLASDLNHRFRQHNGLVKANPRTCKIKEIKGYFDNKGKIGFSMGRILNSAMAMKLCNHVSNTAGRRKRDLLIPSSQPKAL